MVQGSFRRQVGLATHTQFVRSELRRLGIAASDIDDLVQEVWLTGLARLRSFSDEATARAWLGKVCERVAAVELENRGRAPLTARGVPPELSVPPEQDARVEAAFDERRSVAALESLTAKQRDVLSLYGSGDLSMREVAELVGEPEKTVYSRYRTAIDDVTRELRRSDAVGVRNSGGAAWEAPATFRPQSPAQEQAADLGALSISYAGRQLAICRTGNVLIVDWRERAFEWCFDEVSAALFAAQARMQMSLVLINLGVGSLSLPNATERAAGARAIAATRQTVDRVIYVLDSNHPNVRIMKSILNGVFLLTRSFMRFPVAWVDSLDFAPPSVEPHLRTVRGSLPWENVVRAVHGVRRAR